MDLLEGWRVARVLPLIRGRLLDVGCGFNNLVSAYGSGVGVDIFPWDGVDVLVGDPAELPFPDRSFDTVTIVAALNHIPNRAEALIEIGRVLRSCGRLVVTMIGPKTGLLAHALFVRDERTRGGMRPGEKGGMTRQEVVGLLRSCGFTIVREVPFQLGLNRVFVGLKNEDRSA
jgi:SAM-dependent methyltransferase